MEFFLCVCPFVLVLLIQCSFSSPSPLLLSWLFPTSFFFPLRPLHLVPRAFHSLSSAASSREKERKERKERERERPVEWGATVPRIAQTLERIIFIGQGCHGGKKKPSTHNFQDVTYIDTIIHAGRTGHVGFLDM